MLSNLFLHYVFDAWMKRNHPTIPWCRYADDGVAHCETEQQAEALLQELKVRFNECGLELHPDKTKIVYCKDDNRKGKYPKTEFDFLGYTFRSRLVKKQERNEFFISFSPSSMYPVLGHFNKTLVAWAMCKYKKLRGHKTRAGKFIEGISERQPNLFAHWGMGMIGSFA